MLYRISTVKQRSVYFVPVGDITPDKAKKFKGRYLSLVRAKNSFVNMESPATVETGGNLFYLIVDLSGQTLYLDFPAALHEFARRVDGNERPAALYQFFRGRWECVIRRADNDYILFGHRGNYLAPEYAFCDPRVTDQAGIVIWDWIRGRNKDRSGAVITDGAGIPIFSGKSIPHAILRAYNFPLSNVAEGESRIKVIQDDRLLEVGSINLSEFYRISKIFKLTPEA